MTLAAAPPCWRSAAAALLLLCAAVQAAAHLPAGCLRTSDILGCTALGLQRVPAAVPVSTVTLDLGHNRVALLEAGDLAGLTRLETLRLAHNRLTAVRPGAFGNASGPLLRHLDLSSNQIEALEPHCFQELPGLEELLLFDNRIKRVERVALAGLVNLRKAYLSHNRLTDFPFFSIQKHSHPLLRLLDLSSNRLPKLPLEDIARLPGALQQGVYLHNNPLVCDCSMLGLFRYWERRRFPSVTLFSREHVCLVNGVRRGTVRFFLHRRYFDRCDGAAAARPAQDSSVSVREGRPLLLHCVTSLSGRAVSFRWVAPDGEYVAPPGNNDSLRMFANGSLEIVAAREQQAGVYWCLALDRQRRRNETWEVNVTVALQHAADAPEAFNTGFTTLLGCVVSLLLVLMYLYLTPCRCPPRSGLRPPAAAAPGPAGESGAGSAQSSILTPTPPASTEGPGRKVGANKHVVFLEPIAEQQNGRLRAGPQVGYLLEPHTPRYHRAPETDSMVSVFSDTPIMLP